MHWVEWVARHVDPAYPPILVSIEPKATQARYPTGMVAELLKSPVAGKHTS